VIIYVRNNMITFNGSVSESFAFEDALDHIFGKNSWSSKQEITKLNYTIKGNYTEYELSIIMKTLDLKTKGKLNYVKHY
jgi:hypothetical protein